MLPRCFSFRAASGKRSASVFNKNPAEVIDHFKNQYKRVGAG